MSSKHEKHEVDFDKPYEPNEIEYSGIIYFGGGLFLLIVITFGLMWILLGVMEDNAKQKIDYKSPLARSAQEKLPNEPRLQAAPGFGVDGPNGRINLELQQPQSEYNELKKIWDDELKNGKMVKDANGKMLPVTMPIEEAKKKLLEQAPKARAGASADAALKEAQTFVSYSSAGRTRTDRRR